MDVMWSIAGAFRPLGVASDLAPKAEVRSASRWARVELPLVMCAIATLIAMHQIEVPLTHPSRLGYWWSALAFCGRTFQFAAGLIGLCWVIVALRRRRWFIAATLSLLAACAIIPELRAQWPAVRFAKHQPTLRILSVNQLRGNTDTERTFQTILTENPDVIAIQEYSERHDAQLSKQLASHYGFSQRFPFPASNGLALYSRYPMSIDREPSFEFGGKRMMSVDLDVNGKRVRLYNVHPTSPGPPSRIAANRRQVAQLLEAIRDDTLPVIVVGDCNFPLNSQQTDAFRAVGLHPADDSAGTGIRWSWSPLRDGPPVTRIDHVFVSDGFAVESNHIGGPVGSDHRPIIVDLALNQDRADRFPRSR